MSIIGNPIILGGTDTSDATLNSAGQMLNGVTAYADGVKYTGNIPSKAASTYNVSSSDQTISSGQYLSGAQTIRAVTTSNILAENIKSGVTVKVGDAGDAGRIKNVTGTYTVSHGPILFVKVTGDTPTSVTASKSGTSVSLSYDSTLGKWWAELPSTGTWSVKAAMTGYLNSTSVSASSVAVYDVSLTLAAIPSGYTLLQYAQFTGSQYVDIGSITSGGYRIKCTIIPTNITAEAQAIIGAQTYPSRKLLYFAAASKTIVFCPGSADTFSAMAIVNNETYSIDASFFSGNSKFYLNGTNLVDYTTSYTPVSGTAYLGHIHYGDGTSAPGFYGKFQGHVEILNSSGTVTGRLFPVKNSSNVVGYYDTVRRSWIAPSGTLTAGPAA